MNTPSLSDILWQSFEDGKRVERGEKPERTHAEAEAAIRQYIREEFLNLIGPIKRPSKNLPESEQFRIIQRNLVKLELRKAVEDKFGGHNG